MEIFDKKILKACLIILGIIILFCPFIFNYMPNAELGFEECYKYGGDAFTGIQNACAITSKNVAKLAIIIASNIRLCFIILFEIIGTIIITLGISVKD